MVKARGQAEQYARALPTDEGWPPFLIVVDFEDSIELFADFTRSVKSYLPFPDPGSFRISLAELTKHEQRETVRSVWTDPLSLDPSRLSAKVTRELADKLARLAKSMEATNRASTTAVGRALLPVSSSSSCVSNGPAASHKDDGQECPSYSFARVSQFLMRYLFTMSVEDVDLNPLFTELLNSLRGDVGRFPDMVRDLWQSMVKGTFSPILRKKLRRFKGG